METLKGNSPIEKIHKRGMQAVINGDSQKIIGEVRPDEVANKIASLSAEYGDVSQDADGDIIVYKDL